MLRIISVIVLVVAIGLFITELRLRQSFARHGMSAPEHLRVSMIVSAAVILGLAAQAIGLHSTAGTAVLTLSGVLTVLGCVRALRMHYRGRRTAI